MLDAEMEELNINKRSFMKWDSDSDEDDITDADVKKLVIVMQVSRNLDTFLSRHEKTCSSE